MGIREETSKIKALQAHALQDYLEIILHENNISLSTWKQQYASFVEDQHDKNITNVAEVYKRITLNGLASIDIKQLDTSAIINYLRFGKIVYRAKDEKKKTEWYLSLLQDDRNIDAHINGNETASEMYQFAVCELAHLLDFINYVWDAKKGAATGNRYEYTKKYKTIIAQDLKKLDDAYRKEVIEENKRVLGKIRKHKWLVVGLFLILLGFIIYTNGMIDTIVAELSK